MQHFARVGSAAFFFLSVPNKNEGNGGRGLNLKLTVLYSFIN